VTSRLVLGWILIAAALTIWLALVLMVPPLGASPACVNGLDTLEALAATPSVALLDEVEAACGR
jgi:hypothetical protein